MSNLIYIHNPSHHTRPALRRKESKTEVVEFEIDSNKIYKGDQPNNLCSDMNSEHDVLSPIVRKNTPIDCQLNELCYVDSDHSDNEDIYFNIRGSSSYTDDYRELPGLIDIKASHSTPPSKTHNVPNQSALPPIPKISAYGYSDDDDDSIYTPGRNDLPTIPKISAPGYSDEDTTYLPSRNTLPPIPKISAHGYSDDDDDNDDNKPAPFPANRNELPPIPKISAPGYSDDDSEDEDSSYTRSRNNLPPIPKISVPGYSDDDEDTPYTPNRNNLPPIPKISAPGFSDDDDDTIYTPNKTVSSSVNRNDLPPIPKISAPGYSDDDKDTTYKPSRNDLPLIPRISAPDYSDDNENTTYSPNISASVHHNKNELPPIPKISAPGYSDDDMASPPAFRTAKQNIKRKKSTQHKHIDHANSMYFGVRCNGCDKPLTGQAITTSGKRWHPRCFQCQACHQGLEHIAFYEKDGSPYCALDYHELFSPRCDFCKTPIEEHSISALGKTYHAGHFFCRECGKPFDEDSNFLEHEGHAYCEQDFYKKFGKTCKGCEETITGDFLVALGGDWHKECFVCVECGSCFTSSTFLIKGGKPYCDAHTHKVLDHKSKRVVNHCPTSTQNMIPPRTKNMNPPRTKNTNPPSIKNMNPPSIKNGSQNSSTSTKSQCHKCNNPIDGRSFSAFGKNYHPNHFECNYCHKLLSARITGLYQQDQMGEIICKVCVRKNKA
ncbi:hypothetical protein BDB01DRAFT_847513 [Pilobolus umbonatus]|nr:hypothetical protein BDB01DRAFT_847513 [Pilobolus umbonatus]